MRGLSGRHDRCMLPPVAEATVLVLMVLQKVMDWSQPQWVPWACANTASAGAVAMSIAPTVAASATTIRIHLFTPFAVQRTRNNINDN